MSKTPRLIIADADVIIRLHELDLWDKVVEQYSICVAKTVAEIEVRYFERQIGDSRDNRAINLALDARIEIVEPEATTLTVFQDRLSLLDRKSIEIGELETLAATLERKEDGIQACLIDEFAIKCAVLAGLGDSCVSVESVLERCGGAKGLPRDLCNARFDRIVKKANLQRTQNMEL